MPAPVPLLAFLEDRHPSYYGRALDLRQAVANWLAYIPATFPHYTRHTIEHSDEIILQVSKLLFETDSPDSCVVSLSPVEAYLLCVAAYLHDSGMVVSDAEKQALLAVPDWEAWVSDGSGTARWTAIRELREAQDPVQDFIADVQTRYLLAEFIRKRHHFRSADFIEQHHADLAQFDFGDPMLRRYAANICAAHGLRPYELEDRERLPDRCDIRGEIANVRFIAILLRLGDLLDLSNDRACPLLLNAASPLPSDSYAHWSQYSAITQRLTAADRISILASCRDQNEHRQLRDWCQWLVDEVREARTIIARCGRHSEWHLPTCTINSPEATIVVSPAHDASYLALDWTFELDKDEVFARLIHDVYDSPHAFVRELLQNALDATRCQMYSDLVRDGVVPPDSPTAVDENTRQRYALTVSITNEATANLLSGELEQRQVFSIEDMGLGMDREVVQRYLLQVGRSYYTTDEFRRSFKFVPTSRFGIGFLSVFAVSDLIVVETCKPTSLAADGPIRLVLTGPRNYLLVERGNRANNGTRIDAHLNVELRPGELTELVRTWCKRVEFPVRVIDFGEDTLVERERAGDFTYDAIPDVSEEGAFFSVRAIPVAEAGLEGEVYIFSRTTSEGESWAARRWAQYTYPQSHPHAAVPPFPGSLSCLHGLSLTAHFADHSTESYSARIDYRGEGAPRSLGTEWNLTRSAHIGGRPAIRAIERVLTAAISEHLQTTGRTQGSQGWKYKQRLVSAFPLPAFWRSIPGAIRFFADGSETYSSLSDLLSVQRLMVVVPRSSRVPTQPSSSTEDLPVLGLSREEAVPVMTSADIDSLSDAHRRELFQHRTLEGIYLVGERILAAEWMLTQGRVETLSGYRGPISIVTYENPETIGFALHKTTENVYDHCFVNDAHPFVRWIMRVREAALRQQHTTERQFSTLVGLLATPLAYGGHELERLERYVEAWRQLQGLPGDLLPPDIRLDRSAFMPLGR